MDHARAAMEMEAILKKFRALPVMVFGLMAAATGEAGLVKAIREFDGSGDKTLPARISLTGLYEGANPASRVIADGIVPFAINSPLWSDGAAKERFISLPPGAKAAPTDTDSYAFPEGTVFVKNFRVDTVSGDSSSRILVETRFLVRHAGLSEGANPWHGISYRWARDQSDAELVSQDMSENVVVNVRMNGVLRGKRWTFPSKHQCITCHYNRGILGFITPQLNRPSAADPAVNQLQALKEMGVLTANPVADRPSAFRWAGLDEASASLEVRARSYLAANCSNCHGNGPPGSSPGDHVLDYFDPAADIEQGPEGLNGAYIGKRTNQGGDPYPQFIFKGHPESSYVLKRMIVRQDFGFTPTEQMPTLATFQPDSAAVNLIKDWICSMGTRPPGSCRLPQVQSEDGYWEPPASLRGHPPHGRAAPPVLRRGILRVTSGSLSNGMPPALFDLRGRPVALERAGLWEFRALSHLKPGLYLVRSGSATSVVHHLR
jgi:hypothetical protein